MFAGKPWGLEPRGKLAHVRFVEAGTCEVEGQHGSGPGDAFPHSAWISSLNDQQPSFRRPCD